MSTGVGETFTLGPGSLEIGATGSEIDVSCLINNAVIAAEKDEGDSVTKLCGTVVPGNVTYTYSLAGNIDLDIADASGLFAISQSAAGTQVPFTFVPNTDAGTEATGTLVLDPLPFGGDEAGETMTGDFEFTIVGRPAYDIGGAALVEASTMPHKVTPPRVSPPSTDPEPEPADDESTMIGAGA
jgi:hypothetical protein